MSTSSESSADPEPPEPDETGESEETVGEPVDESLFRGRRPFIIGTVVLAAVVGIVVAWLLGGGGDGDSEPDGEFGVTDAYISVSMDVAAGYITVHNPGPDDELVAVSSPAADTTGLMAGGGGGHDGADLNSLPIPVGTTELYPGGDHIMLQDMPEALEPGETVELELTFERAGTETVEAEVLTLDEVIRRSGG